MIINISGKQLVILFLLCLLISIRLPISNSVSHRSEKINADIYEPNDSFEDATIIIVNSTQHHSLDPEGDIDYFKFSLDTDSYVTIYTNGTDGDTELNLYDNKGTFLTYNDDSETRFSLLELVGLREGNYYFKINEYYNDTIQSYNITLRAFTADISIEEPNNSFQTAVFLLLNSTPQFKLFPEYDKDYFYFETNKPISLSVVISSDISDEGDTLLTIFDNSFNELFYNDDCDSSYYSCLENIQLDSGKYYLMIEEYNGEILESYTIQIYSSSIIDDFSSETFINEYSDDDFEFIFPIAIIIGIVSIFIFINVFQGKSTSKEKKISYNNYNKRDNDLNNQIENGSYCPSCEKINYPEDIYCFNCGIKLN